MAIEVKEKTDRSSDVKSWAKYGGRTAVYTASKGIADRVAQSLSEEKTPFLMSMRGETAVFTVRDIDREALLTAEERTRFRLNQAACMYSYPEMRDLNKKDPTVRDKQLVHIEGLSEEEALLFEDELYRYSGGIPFAEARMMNDTVTFAFQLKDMKASDGYSRRKKRDVLTLLTAAELHLYGPGAKDILGRVRDKARAEMAVAGAREYLLTRRHPYLYVYDETAPFTALRIGKEGISFGSVSRDGGSFQAGDLIPYDDSQYYPDSVYRFLHEAAVIGYTREEAEYLQVSLDSGKAKASKRLYLAYLRRSMLERILAGSLTDLFWEMENTDYLQDPERTGMILARQQLFIAQAVEGKLNKDVLAKAQAAAKHVKLDLSAYRMAADRCRASQILVFVPEEERIRVDRELKRIKQEMKYNDHGLDAEIQASQEEAKRMQEDRFARVNGVGGQ